MAGREQNSFIKFRGQDIAELHQQGISFAGVADATAVAPQGRILADGQREHRHDAGGLQGDGHGTASVGDGGVGHDLHAHTETESRIFQPRVPEKPGEVIRRQYGFGIDKADAQALTASQKLQPECTAPGKFHGIGQQIVDGPGKQRAVCTGEDRRGAGHENKFDAPGFAGGHGLIPDLPEQGVQLEHFRGKGCGWGHIPHDPQEPVQAPGQFRPLGGVRGKLIGQCHHIRQRLPQGLGRQGQHPQVLRRLLGLQGNEMPPVQGGDGGTAVAAGQTKLQAQASGLKFGVGLLTGGEKLTDGRAGLQGETQGGGIQGGNFSTLHPEGGPVQQGQQLIDLFHGSFLSAGEACPIIFDFIGIIVPFFWKNASGKRCLMVDHTEHRKRVKQRFLGEGLDYFTELHTLELLLFFGKPQGDTNGLAHELLDHFGNLNQVLTAPPEQLMQVKGVGEHVAVLIGLVKGVAQKYLIGYEDRRAPLRTMEDCGRYLMNWYVGRRDETVILLCLDARRVPLACRVISEGSVNIAEISVRKVVEAALALNATTAVLAHNHPSGLAIPSMEDIVTTRRMGMALDAVGVILEDHIVVAGRDYVSLRDSNYYDPETCRMMV